MSHDIDTTLWLTGANYTETSNFMLDRGGNNLEDYAVVQSLLSSGAIVRHQVDWLSPTKIRETRILCANGMIIADTINNTVKTIQRIDGKSFETLFHADPGALEPLELQHLEFQKLLEKKYSAIATLDDGIKVIEIISSIFK
jgi:predicted dehydrogenase